MQTILGSGGIIGIELARSLTEYTDHIRLVSRKPEKVNNNDELVSADLTREEMVLPAVKGSEVVYLTAGLPYRTKIWQQTWPVIMQNVINACLEHDARLVFFDNIYMYSGDDLDPITEENTIDPPSKKGLVRANNVRLIENAVKNQGLKALIARSADFYGPSIRGVSILTEVVFNPLSKGKKANWFGSVKYKHSFTYTPDAGKATALLGNTEKAYGETWHLPTAPDPYTGEEWIRTIAGEFNVKARYQVAGKGMVSLLGLFSPMMRELREMIYQYDRDYVFNSDKFEKAFNFTPTPYIEGIREIIRKDYKK